MDYKIIVKNIRNNLSEYIKNYKIESLVIGVSGGIDSAICCALAKPICDKLKVELLGYSIPIYSKKEEVDRAKEIGSLFCNSFVNYTGMEKIYDVMCKEPHMDLENKVRLGNIKARLRMIYLYDQAKANNGLVLSTDNYSENLLGYFTIFGDMGDFGIIQNLWKTEIYELSNYILNNEIQFNSEKKEALNNCIKCAPTAGLGITENDFEEIGCNSYKEIDSILKEYLSLAGRELVFEDNINKRKELLKHPVIVRYFRSKYKRNHPYNIPLNKIMEGVV